MSIKETLGLTIALTFTLGVLIFTYNNYSLYKNLKELKEKWLPEEFYFYTRIKNLFKKKTIDKEPKKNLIDSHEKKTFFYKDEESNFLIEYSIHQIILEKINVPPITRMWFTKGFLAEQNIGLSYSEKITKFVQEAQCNKKKSYSTYTYGSVSFKKK